MMMIRSFTVRCLLAAFACWGAAFATLAAPVTWTVDSTNSYLRLTIPDQAVTVTNGTTPVTVTVQFRNASSSTSWTDAGGRRAALAGQILTDYEDGVSISFRGGEHNLYALEQTLLRPNPAAWDSVTNAFTNTTTAAAALGARVRGYQNILIQFDMAFFAMRQAFLDITNTLPGVIPLSGGAFAGGTTQCGISRARADVDGLELPLGLGQPVPDILNGEMAPGTTTNNAGGVITNITELQRKLTYTLTMNNLAMEVGGTVMTGSVAGLVIAYATVPPPPPPQLHITANPGFVVLSWPATATGYSLQSTPVLTAPNWSTNGPLPVVVNGRYVVTNGITGPAVFYRLRKP